MRPIVLFLTAALLGSTASAQEGKAPRGLARAQADIARFCEAADDPDLCAADQQAELTRFLLLLAGMQRRAIPTKDATACMTSAKSGSLIDWSRAADCLAQKLGVED